MPFVPLPSLYSAHSPSSKVNLTDRAVPQDRDGAFDGWDSVIQFGGNDDRNRDIADNAFLNEINPNGSAATLGGKATVLTGTDPEIELTVSTTPQVVSFVTHGIIDDMTSGTNTLFATAQAPTQGYQFRVSVGQIQLLKQNLAILSSPSHKTLLSGRPYTFGIVLDEGVTFEIYLDGRLLSSGTPTTATMNRYFMVNKRFAPEDWDGSVIFAACTARRVSQAEMKATTADYRRLIRPSNGPFINVAAAAVGGRIMGSLAGKGGLAGPGGIAGIGGGLAG